VCTVPPTTNFILTMELANGFDMSWARVNPPFDQRGMPAPAKAVFWWWGILLVGSWLYERRRRRAAVSADRGDCVFYVGLGGTAAIT
jgi:hypothetical protein